MSKIMGLFEITGTYHRLSEREQKQISDKAKKQFPILVNEKYEIVDGQQQHIKNKKGDK